MVYRSTLKKPQKSSKNKKIKSIDPFYTGDRPADRLLEKYNLKPKCLSQEFSNRACIIRNLKKEAKISTKKSRKNKFYIDKNENLSEKERGICRSVETVPDFKRHKNEDDEMLLRRVERETQTIIQKTRFEDKYGINQEPDILDFLPEKNIKMSSSKIHENLFKRKEKQIERLKLKKEKLKSKKHDKMDEKFLDFNQLTDDIKFGECVHQPPLLTARPRKSQVKSISTNLLLDEKLGRTFVKNKKSNDILKARDEAILIYRQIKARNYFNRN